MLRQTDLQNCYVAMFSGICLAPFTRGLFSHTHQGHIGITMAGTFLYQREPLDTGFARTSTFYRLRSKVSGGTPFYELGP